MFITLIKYLRTPKLFIFILGWMIVLVFIGTIAQKHMGLFAVQNKYFSSWILWIYYIPFPGGRLTMLILFINLSIFTFSQGYGKRVKLEY